MTNPVRLLSALALVALSIPIGCHEDQGPRVNSETHFLKSCADGCGPALECICGVCSRACASNDECSDLNPNAECALACAEAPSPMMCDLPCSADADCAGFDPPLACAAGVCRPEPPGSSAAPDTPEAYCTALIDRYIEFFARCYAASTDSWRRFLHPSFVCGNAAEAVANGRLTFSSRDAEACLTSAEALATSAACGAGPSSDVLTGSDSCKNALKSAVPVGGTCLSFHILELFGECEDNGFCDQGGADSCAGTCKARGKEGEACDLLNGDPPCIKGLSCSHSVCVTPAGLGETCEGPSAANCAADLYCEGGSSSQPGACRERTSSGACTENDACAGAHFCDATGSCAPYRAVGEACTAGNGECYPLLSYCSAGKCAAKLPALGEACGTIEGETVPCGEGYCDKQDATQGVCVAEKQPGEACTGTPALSECAGDNGRCDMTTLECTACQR